MCGMKAEKRQRKLAGKTKQDMGCGDVGWVLILIQDSQECDDQQCEVLVGGEGPGESSDTGWHPERSTVCW